MHNSITTSGVKIWLITYLLICLAGTILNLLILLSIATYRRLQTGSRWLVIHKIVTDTVLCSVMCPIGLLPTFSAWVGQSMPYFDCSLVDTFQTIFAHLGNWTSLFLGVNRFIALLAPHSYHKTTSKQALCIFILTIWMVVLSEQLPTYFGIGVSSGCNTIKVTNRAVLFSMLTVGQYFPAVVLGILYITIFTVMAVKRRNSVAVRVNATTFRRNVLRRKITLAKTLCAAEIWNIMCNMPAVIVMLAVPPEKRPGRLVSWLHTTVLLGYAAHPPS
ncbi:melanopsin-like [Paramacrobiotus metropolitanus]|uniref:melanopsin-like n=1 Tax=Paramacrobiotus metropolitanus TaxID=2943436 RepID=UPI0024459179|nr:melanopsin-like [Paramacrobiotus metropolitanus]